MQGLCLLTPGPLLQVQTPPPSTQLLSTSHLPPYLSSGRAIRCNLQILTFEPTGSPSSLFQAPRTLRLPRLPFFTKWKKNLPSPQNSPPPPPQIKGQLPLQRRNPPQPPKPLPLPPQLPIRPSPKEGPPLSRLETTPITTPVHSSRYLKVSL